ncbi:MAG: PAS domain-containing protein [Acidobacteriota bacterium]
MTDLPAPIRDFIDRLNEDTRSPAYLLFNEANELSEWGGDLESYGVTGLEKAMIVGEYLPFFSGLLPLDTNSAFLPNVQTTEGVFADIYLFRGNQDTWALFLDATARASKQQRLQQRTYNLGLQVSDLERETGSLGEAKGLLEQRVSEQTAELSLTVRTLQRELAEGRQVEQKLRESESRFRSLYDLPMLGVMFLDPNGKIIEANDSFLESLGYARDDLTLGIIEWSRITGSRLPVHEEIPTKRQFLRKDGSPVTLLFGTGPQEGFTGKMVGFTVDLSQRRSSQQTQP